MSIDTNTTVQASRRHLLCWLARAGAAALTAAAGAAYATKVEPRWLAVERVTVRLAALPPAWSGLRIAQLSDLHRCRLTGLAQIARAVDATLALQPDLIVLTGDYVSERASYAQELVPVLARLAAPLGVFGVLGNHDYWTDAAEVTACLCAGGVEMLPNQARRLERSGAALWLAGVDDVWERRADLPAVRAGLPDGAPVVLLAHEPDYADLAARHGIMLQLSGHSHGGQVRIPGLRPPVLPYLGARYPLGLKRVGSMQVYTNRGIGSTPLGLRLNCRPEVTLLTLVGSGA